MNKEIINSKSEELIRIKINQYNIVKSEQISYNQVSIIALNLIGIFLIGLIFSIDASFTDINLLFFISIVTVSVLSSIALLSFLNAKINAIYLKYLEKEINELIYNTFQIDNFLDWEELSNIVFPSNLKLNNQNNFKNYLKEANRFKKRFSDIFNLVAQIFSFGFFIVLIIIFFIYCLIKFINKGNNFFIYITIFCVFSVLFTFIYTFYILNRFDVIMQNRNMKNGNKSNNK